MDTPVLPVAEAQQDQLPSAKKPSKKSQNSKKVPNLEEEVALESNSAQPEHINTKRVKFNQVVEQAEFEPLSSEDEEDSPPNSQQNASSQEDHEMDFENVNSDEECD